ncbi:hypothetical protein KR032_011371, partial [Drosophila birchii]
MDAADFWQQARAPFGLQTALHQYNSNPSTSHPHNNAMHSTIIPQEEHDLLSDIHPQDGTITGTDSGAGQNPPKKIEASHHHHHHHHSLQQHMPQAEHQQSYAGQDSAAPQLSNHHLLFNAAAAAAAAAHLKSTAAMQNNLSSPLRDQKQNYGLCVIKPKLEVEVKPNRQQSLNDCHQQQQLTYAGDFYDDRGPGATETTASVGSTTDAESQSQQSVVITGSGCPQAPPELGSKATLSPGPPRGECGAASAESVGGPGSESRPTTIISNSHQQQSPQHSITPSGGSSTPEIKYNKDKMVNDIQLQLSRSSSAAAISERTLEECWSTLQRLFMHKSAMQQIQQQIPRVGLGGGGTGTSNLGGSITPGLGTDTKPHQCQQCMKSFSSNHQLVQHIRVHTGEKPYKCSYCDRRFKQLSHVQQHTRLHTGERPYKCHLPDCGRAFIQLSNLQQHLRNHDAQVERAKNRPFHCNICGKGFATESSLRTHTSKELQLHLGVLQQHAALIGGPNATSCPVCHKLFLGTEALVDHMKHVHKDKSPTLSGSAVNQFSDLNQATATGSGNGTGNGSGEQLCASSESSCVQAPSGSNLVDSYLGKRRTANHPCPVCGKHYVNEGSLRKHLACHAETSQLANSLRMWPCSVCQAVFTHENGLLTHMESMRMDPKHQFAAQYVLSRAAAEQRERDSILAVTLAASGTSGGTARLGVDPSRNLLPIVGGSSRHSDGSNSKCPSPSANSECSSTGRLSSSTTSDQDQEHDHSENENCLNNNNSNSNLNKMTELRRLPSANPGQYGHIDSMDTELQVANRMSLMAAAAAAVAASRPQQDGGSVDSVAVVPSAAVQAAVVNLAAAMRMNTSSNGSAGGYQQQHVSSDDYKSRRMKNCSDCSMFCYQDNHSQVQQPHPHQNSHHAHPHPQPPHHHHHHQQQQPQPQQQQQHHPVPQQPQLSHLLGHPHPGNTNSSRSQRSPNITVPNLQSESSPAAMNVHMMRGSLDHQDSSSHLGSMHPIDVIHQQHHHHQTSNFSQHAVAPTSSSSHPHAHPHHTASHHLHPDPETALRIHQAEAILRSHTEAAFRLATGAAGVKSEAEQHLNGSNNASN